MLGYKSIVSIARSRGEYIRTTIPIEIRRELNLAPGDILDWEINAKDNKKFLVVRKLE